MSANILFSCFFFWMLGIRKEFGLLQVFTTIGTDSVRDGGGGGGKAHGDAQGGPCCGLVAAFVINYNSTHFPPILSRNSLP